MTVSVNTKKNNTIIDFRDLYLHVFMSSIVEFFIGSTEKESNTIIIDKHY